MGNVILTGFMGCGKSSLGIKLSYRLRMALLDTDKIIEKEQGCTITELFEQRGEEAFRQLETQCIKDIGKKKDFYIISVGGGLPIKEENRKLLKDLGLVVYLRIRPETVYERLKEDTTRPLLQGDNPQEKIRKLMEQRKSFYEDGADLIVDVDDADVEQVIYEIAQCYRKRQGRKRKNKKERTGKEKEE